LFELEIPNMSSSRQGNGEWQAQGRELLKDALLSGSSASIASAAVLAACSKYETGSAAAGMNGPSQWIWGRREAARANRASLKHTAIGYLIHHATSVFWAVLYERAFGRRMREQGVSTLQIAATAAATTAAAYVVDYQFTPKRLQPGFEQHVGPSSMFATYAGFALGLAVMTLLRRR
jgi:hypothetical protein